MVGRRAKPDDPPLSVAVPTLFVVLDEEVSRESILPPPFQRGQDDALGDPKALGGRVKDGFVQLGHMMVPSLP